LGVERLFLSRKPSRFTTRHRCCVLTRRPVLLSNSACNSTKVAP
jgi:hypothetical protein